MITGIEVVIVARKVVHHVHQYTVHRKVIGGVPKLTCASVTCGKAHIAGNTVAVGVKHPKLMNIQANNSEFTKVVKGSEHCHQKVKHFEDNGMFDEHPWLEDVWENSSSELENISQRPVRSIEVLLMIDLLHILATNFSVTFKLNSISLSFRVICGIMILC